MTATTPSTALATIQPAFSDAERLAIVGPPAPAESSSSYSWQNHPGRLSSGWCADA
jgi:hypothetical protein